MFGSKYDLIITIVNKGNSATVIQAARAAGASGATVLKGQGSSLEGVVMLFEVPIEPEKDIVLCAVPQEISEDVLANISQYATLEKTGAGISFVIPIKNIAGMKKKDADKSDMD